MLNRLSRSRTLRYRAAAAATTVVAGISIALLAWTLRTPSNRIDEALNVAFTEEPSLSIDDFASPAATAAASIQPLRAGTLTCEHSVVAGGVYSAADIAQAVSVDPVVREHYSGISVDKIQVIKASARRDAYMSYRIGDRVYWSAQKVTLAEGETFLTDGTKTIQARCGSLLSDGSLSPTLVNEPKLLQFDSIEPPVQVATANAAAGEMGPAFDSLRPTPGTSAVTSPTSSGPARRALSGGGMSSGGGAASAGAPDRSPSAAATTEGSPSGNLQRFGQRLTLTDGGEQTPAQAAISEPFAGRPFSDSFSGEPGLSHGIAASAETRPWMTALESAPNGVSVLGLPTLVEGFPEGVAMDQTLAAPGFVAQTENGGSTAADIVPVPEPTSLLLFGSGLGLMAWGVRRHQSRGRSS